MAESTLQIATKIIAGVATLALLIDAANAGGPCMAGWPKEDGSITSCDGGQSVPQTYDECQWNCIRHALPALLDLCIGICANIFGNEHPEA